MRSHARLLALTALATAVIAACATVGHRPPPLRQLKPDVRTQMGAMATAINEVEWVLQSDASLTPGDAEQVVKLLTRLEAAAQALDPATFTALAHPDLSRHLPTLRTAAADAVREAKQDPPKYEAFGTLVGVCNNCHRTPL